MMPSPCRPLAHGVTELRIWDEAGTFRVVYVAKFEDAVYVLHCFQKKSPKTSRKDIDLASKRFRELRKELAP
jgi:phage-related protein